MYDVTIIYSFAFHQQDMHLLCSYLLMMNIVNGPVEFKHILMRRNMHELEYLQS